MKYNMRFLICLMIVSFGCNAPEREIPETLIGNYYDKSGKDFWEYSLQKKFIIYDTQFWNVTKVVNRKDATKIFIKTQNSKRKLVIRPVRSNEFEFENNKNSKTYSTISNPNLRKAKNRSFALHSGKVEIYGFIKNSIKYIESNPKIQFLYHDYVIKKTHSVYAPIDSLGRFQLEMELLSAQDIMYKFNNKLYSAFVSPDDTLMIYFDPEHPEKTDFQGSKSDINYDLLNTKERRYEIASSRENNNQLSKHFNEYNAYKDSVSKKEMRFLNEYSNNDYCSELFKIWYKTDSKIRFDTDLLNYSWKNYYPGDVENSMEAFNEYLNTFFEEINMNDSVAMITGRYFFYTNAINNKIPRDRKALTTLINNELSVDDRKEKFSEMYIKKRGAIINTMEKGRLKDILLTKLVSGEIKSRRMENIDKTFDLVDNQIQYKPYLTHLSNYIANFKRKGAEFENNPITLRKSNSTGDQLLKKIIKDNKDNVIILDFWFTGCGACRKDFETMKEFKKDLSIEVDVEFVYLCYSSTEKNWKYVSKEYNLQGQNYLLTQEQNMYFKKLFSISSAPRYILINKAGKIVNLNSSPTININQFMKEIKNAR